MEVQGSSPIERDAVHRAAERMHQQAIRLLRRLRREDAAIGLPPARASALSVLVFGGPSSMGDLAQAEQVTAPTMSRVVAALVADGLVTREGDPADGRVVRLRATERGEELLREGKARRLRAFSRLLQVLEDTDLATLERAADLLDGVLR